MLKKVLMVLRRQMVAVVLVVVVVLTTAVAVLTTRQTIKTRVARAARNAQQIDIEVRAFVGIPAENKLGGIEFEVSDRWGYDENDRIIFFAYFDQGLKLNRVICLIYHNGKYIKRDYREGGPNWITWLVRYEEVLTEATTGEKAE